MMQLIVTTITGYLLGRFLANRTSVSFGTVTVGLLVVGISGLVYCLHPVVFLPPLIAIRMGFGLAMRP